jgi:transcriptional regulator with XRE-family HTH domain
MIRTEREYQKALEQLSRGKVHLETQKSQLAQAGLVGEELEHAMHPLLSFRAQLEEEVLAYENMKRGDLGTLERLDSIGRWLIGARIARGWSQRELAQRLSVSEAQVSRDERNEYHGVTVERAQRILEVMGVSFQMEEHLEMHPLSARPNPEALSESEGTVSHLPVDIPKQVFAFLRADPKLSPTKAEKLAQMFELAYEAAANKETA